MSPRRTTAAQAAQANYQLSDDEGDELLGSEPEDTKPSNLETSQILKGQLQEPRYKTVNLRQLHGAYPPVASPFATRSRPADRRAGNVACCVRPALTSRSHSHGRRQP